MNTLSIGYALLAVQNALLDVITPELRAVVVNTCEESESMYLHFYHDGEVSEELIDLWQCAITEATDVGPNGTLDDGIERLDYPQTIPLQGRYAYLRKEPYIQAPQDGLELPVFITGESVDLKEEGAQFAAEVSPNDINLTATSCRATDSQSDWQFAKIANHGQNHRCSAEWSCAIFPYEKINPFVSPVTGERFNTTRGVIHGAMGARHMIPGRPETSKIAIFPVAYAQLAIQRALLGKATPELRAIVVDVPKEEKQAYIRFFYHGQVSEQLIALWECAIAETWADLGPEYVLDAEVQRLDYPHEIPFRGRYAYARYE